MMLSFKTSKCYDANTILFKWANIQTGAQN